MNEKWLLPLVFALAGATVASGQEVAAPKPWSRQEQAFIGPDRPVAVVWAPTIKRFMSLGWISNQYTRRAPYTYDELAFDSQSGQWENWLPEGKDWGPRFGLCKPPTWKDSKTNLLTDVEGNIRPNWAQFYWLQGSANNFTYLPDQRTFLFYIHGRTFSYDPQRREWKDLAPAGDPQGATPLKSQFFWGSLCYDEARKRVVLFGGGNADTPSGDPGTWLYDPAENSWRELSPQRRPPPRANSQLVYDPSCRKVILFGGDQLDQTIADTWVFDGSEWTQKSPALSPSPRAGHAFLWLPKAKKLLLLGGYTVSSTTEYTSHPYRSLPLEAWTYDEAEDAWRFIKRFEPSKESPASPRYRELKAAVDADDQIALVDSDRKLWLGGIDVTHPDEDGRNQFGVVAGTVDRRTGPYDPAWYEQDVPAADASAVTAELEALPVNRWTLRPTPKRPAPNMDWGSAVFAPELDLIIRFSGGHSAYCGTAPQVYDVKTDRYSIPFAPEFPIDWTFTNDQVPGERSFRGNPWMTGHTYKSTGYDTRLKALVFAPHQYTYFFDPKAGKWSRNEEISPFRADFYTVTLTSTPGGLTAWANTPQAKAGLWRLNATSKVWEPLSVKGPLFNPKVDNSGAAYDSKRDRLLLFIRGEKSGCRLAAYDFKTGEVQELQAVGATGVAEDSREHAIFREAVYLPADDLVMIGATGLIYDCAKNAWFKKVLPSDKPLFTKEGSYNIGVMVDPQRNLVWGVNTNSQVFALKFSAATAGLEPVRDR